MEDANLRAALKSFFGLNPGANLEKLEDAPLEIHHPWNDETLAIQIPEEDETIESLIDTLNNVHLPENLSAIHHKDSNILEVIFTSMRLSRQNQEIMERKFKFSYEDNLHNCYFGKSSDRLLKIARSIRQVSAPTHTDHRNLQSFIAYLSDTAVAEKYNWSPKSFYIENFSYNGDDATKFIQCLNFYMRYFDTRTPTVLIHSEVEIIPGKSMRYRDLEFPDEILAKNIDENLFGLWNSLSTISDQLTRFLTCFRIIEYCAKLYMDVNTTTQIRRILSRPHIGAQVVKATQEIAGIVSDQKRDEFAQLRMVLNDVGVTEGIWRHIDANRSYFISNQTFDGGFEIDGLVTDKCGITTFSKSYPDNVIRSIKNIRNNLSHGQEATSKATIIPTNHNRALIQPYADLIELLAGEAILMSYNK